MKRTLALILVLLLLLTTVPASVFAEEESAGQVQVNEEEPAPAPEPEPEPEPEPPHQHDYKETSRTEADCTSSGEIVRACSCGDTQTETIPALGHDYKDGVCARCGASDPDYKPATEEPAEPTPEPTSESTATPDPEVTATPDPEASVEPSESPTPEPTESPEPEGPFKVTWINYDGSVLEIDTEVEKGSKAEYNGGTPVFPGTPAGGHIYVFKEFGQYVEGSVKSTDFIVNEDMVFKAKYENYKTSSYSLFNVHYMVYNGKKSEEMKQYFRQSAKKIGSEQNALDYKVSISGYSYAMASQAVTVIEKNEVNDLYLYYVPSGNASEGKVNIGSAAAVLADTKLTAELVNANSETAARCTYTWYAIDDEGKPNPVASEKEYTVHASDEGRRVYCEAYDTGKNQILLPAAAVPVVGMDSEAEIIETENCSGVLKVVYTAVEDSTEGKLAYEWFRVDDDSTELIGTEATYTLTADDAEKNIRCKVTDTTGTSGGAIAAANVYSIETAVTGEGVVTPEGTVYTVEGAAPVFTFKAAEPSELISVKVDGEEVETEEGVYIFDTIEASHKLDVEFGIDGAVSNEETFTVTWINYDNSVLRVDEGVEAGTVAEYKGGTPIFPNEVPEGYVYVFSKFGLYVPGQATQDTDFIVTEDTTYKAKFVRYNADNYALFNVHCVAGEAELPDYFRQSAKKIGNVQTAAMNIESIDGYYYVRASEESVLIAKGSTNDLYLYYAPILGTAEIVESETAKNTLEVSGIPAEFTDPQYEWYRVSEDGTMTLVGQEPTLECNDDTVGSIRCEIKNSEGAIVAEATVCCIDVTVIGEGTVSPEGNAYVLPGANRTFTFSKATEYTIDDDQTATGDSVTFDNIQESHKLTVVFVKQVSHSITTTGNLSEVLKLDSVSDLGNNVTYKWFRVDNGTDVEIGHESLYQLTSADKVAGKVIKCMASGTTAYTIAETTIHKITASAGSNGTVTPNGTVYTINGARPKFTFSADASYKVDTVTADSQSQTASTSYTFPALDKAKATSHTVKVTFTSSGSGGSGGSGGTGGGGSDGGGDDDDIEGEEAEQHMGDEDEGGDSADAGILVPDPNMEDVPDEYLMECDAPGMTDRVEYTTDDGRDYYALVYTPDGYDPELKYNILYIVPGENETPEDVIGTEEDPTILRLVLDNMIKNEKIEPLLVAVPSLYPEDYVFEEPELTEEEMEEMGIAPKAEEETEEDDTEVTEPDEEPQITVEELAEMFPDNWSATVIPTIESKYSTYAETTDDQGLIDSREHRAISGFTAGAAVTWYAFANKLSYAADFIPISGDCWILGRTIVERPEEGAEDEEDPYGTVLTRKDSADDAIESDTTTPKLSTDNLTEDQKLIYTTTALTLTDALYATDYWIGDFYIYALTGSEDSNEPSMTALIAAMYEQKSTPFIFNTNRQIGDICYHVKKGAEADVGMLGMYYMNVLPDLWVEEEASDEDMYGEDGFSDEPEMADSEVQSLGEAPLDGLGDYITDHLPKL